LGFVGKREVRDRTRVTARNPGCALIGNRNFCQWFWTAAGASVTDGRGPAFSLRQAGTPREGTTMTKKKKKSKKSPKSPVSTASAVPPTLIKTELATYADGTPLDRITYLEAKLILKPDRFTSVQNFRDFGKIVKATAKKVGVGFIADPNSERRPEVREITFGDTPDFRLYNNAFILRRRITYVDGFPVGDPEIVFKYRHPDEQKAMLMDVHPKIAGKYRIKFKAEALPLKDSIGGYRILYSHNCQFGLSQVHDPDKSLMATLVKILPALTSIKKSDGERICLVTKGLSRRSCFRLAS
jgi:hypothetical protein